MEVKYEWIDLELNDLTDDEKWVVTRDFLENRLNDQFEAVEVDKDNLPSTIWMKNTVVKILNREFLFGEIPMIYVKRNP